MIDRRLYINSKFNQLGSLCLRFCVAKSAGKEDQAFNLWKRFEDCSQECKRLDAERYQEYLNGYPTLAEANATELLESTIANAKSGKALKKSQLIASQGNLLTN